MRIAIIGGGFTGLSAAYYLQKHDHQTVIFERERFLGGLAGGLRHLLGNDFPEEWEWDLEQFYHHWFTNDEHVFNLGREIGVGDKFITRRPTTSILYQDQIYPFDSPLDLLRFPHLSLLSRLRTGATLANLKYLTTLESSQRLENITAVEYLKKHTGNEAFQKIWQPLLRGKFADYCDEINMRWFWARIYKRTPQLVYYQGGFSEFINDLVGKIKQLGGTILTNTRVEKIVPWEKNRHFQLLYNSSSQINTDIFDRVIVTTPPRLLTKMIDNLPDNFQSQIKQQKGVGALVLVLALHHPLMNQTYWLNVNDLSWPFLAVVEHTNFMPANKYGRQHIVYVGDYLSKDHPRMNKSPEELTDEFTPYLKRINPLFSPESIAHSFLFKTPYAQPIVSLNHQSNILPLQTPIEGLYLASMAQVYPWDRGTNYAIELGREVAQEINNH